MMQNTELSQRDSTRQKRIVFHNQNNSKINTHMLVNPHTSSRLISPADTNESHSLFRIGKTLSKMAEKSPPFQQKEKVNPLHHLNDIFTIK